MSRERIAELSHKWQDRASWIAAFTSAKQFKRYWRHGGGERDHRRFEGLAERAHEEVTKAHSELIELENLVRQSFPELLRLVPETNFFEGKDDPEARVRLRELEGTMLTSPPGHSDGAGHSDVAGDSRPVPIKTWAEIFHQSETWVKDKVRDEWIPAGMARRVSERGRVSISLTLLKELGVDPPE